MLSLGPEQSVAIHDVAVEDERGNAAGVPDVGGGIGIEDEDVSASA